MVQNPGEVKRACGVVAAVTVTGTEIVLEEKVAAPGFTLQLTPVGAPAQESDTVPTKLLLLARTRLKVAACPATTVADVLPLAENANVPGPLTVTVVFTLVLTPEVSVEDPVTV